MIKYEMNFYDRFSFVNLHFKPKT